MANIPALPPFMAQWMGFVLGRVADMSNAMFDRALQPLGISGPHLGVLMTLAHHGAMVQARLSDHTRIDKGAMVRFVNELVAGGYVERQPNPDDKRAVLVHLTERGRELLERAIAVGTQVTLELFSVLSPDEQQIFQQMLIRIAARAEPEPLNETDADESSTT